MQTTAQSHTGGSNFARSANVWSLLLFLFNLAFLLALLLAFFAAVRAKVSQTLFVTRQWLVDGPLAMNWLAPAAAGAGWVRTGDSAAALFKQQQQREQEEDLQRRKDSDRFEEQDDGQEHNNDEGNNGGSSSSPVAVTSTRRGGQQQQQSARIGWNQPSSSIDDGRSVAAIGAFTSGPQSHVEQASSGAHAPLPLHAFSFQTIGSATGSARPLTEPQLRTHHPPAGKT